MTLKRPSVLLARPTLLGTGLGLVLAVAAAFAPGPGSAAPRALAPVLLVAACGAAGALVACRRRVAEDLRYILRLREELRASQDHVMETARYRALGPYLEIAAHQVREPLQKLAAAAQALDADPALPASARAPLASLRAHLATVQESLRGLASYALGKPARTPFNVNTLIQEGIRLVRHRAEEKGIRFAERYAVLPPVAGPAGRVHEAILNVIVNAIEAMPYDGGPIEVETAHVGDRVVARVRDAGIGIRPEHAGRVFDPFFTTKPDRGAGGLGLWSARQTLDLIGADITIASVPLGGTEVAMSFPQAAPIRPGREGTEHPQELPVNRASDRDLRIA